MIVDLFNHYSNDWLVLTLFNKHLLKPGTFLIIPELYFGAGPQLKWKLADNFDISLPIQTFFFWCIFKTKIIKDACQSVG